MINDELLRYNNNGNITVATDHLKFKYPGLNNDNAFVSHIFPKIFNLDSIQDDEEAHLINWGFIVYKGLDQELPNLEGHIRDKHNVKLLESDCKVIGSYNNCQCIVNLRENYKSIFGDYLNCNPYTVLSQNHNLIYLPKFKVKDRAIGGDDCIEALYQYTSNLDKFIGCIVMFPKAYLLHVPGDSLIIFNVNSRHKFCSGVKAYSKEDDKYIALPLTYIEPVNLQKVRTVDRYNKRVQGQMIDCV